MASGDRIKITDGTDLTNIYPVTASTSSAGVLLDATGEGFGEVVLYTENSSGSSTVTFTVIITVDDEEVFNDSVIIDRNSAYQYGVVSDETIKNWGRISFGSSSSRKTMGFNSWGGIGFKKNFKVELVSITDNYGAAGAKASLVR